MIKKYLLLATLALFPILGNAQVKAAGSGGNQSLYVGAFGSYFSPDYGFNNVYGVGGFGLYNLTPKLGVEGEARFMRYNQDNHIHFDNYLIGPHYNFYQRRKFTAYGKVLFGIGEFEFPYTAAHGGYGALAFGGGVDYRFAHKWSVEGDYEYQDWPGFVGQGPRPHGLTPNGASIGVVYRIF